MLLLLGFVLYGLMVTGIATMHVDVLAALFAGLGDTLLLLAWGRVFARHSPKESLFCVAFAYSVGSVVGTLCAGLAPQAVALTSGILCALASCALALSEDRVSDGLCCPTVERGTGAAGSSFEPAAPHMAHEAGTLADVASFLWKPVVAALLCAFVTGAANTAGAGMGLKSAAFHLLGTVAIGGCLVAVICLSGKPFNLRQFYKVFIPLAAIVILCIPLLDADVFPGGALLMYVLNGCGFALIDIATISALATCVHVLRVPSDAVFGLERFLGAPAMLAGSQMQPVFTDAGMRTVCALAVAVFLGAVVVSLVRANATYSTTSFSGRPDAHGSGVDSGVGQPVNAGASKGIVCVCDGSMLSSSAPMLMDDSTCCQVLSRTGGLTPRESQVLEYLVRGRGSTYISQELCISVQTVKTHTKHIYDKLEVHSREELLTLVEQTRRGEIG